MLLLTLSFAVVWLLLTGQFTVTNFFFGFFVTYGVLWLFGRVIHSSDPEAQMPRFFSKVFEVFAFSLFFLWELVLANVRVAVDLLRWRPKMEPAVVKVSLQDFSDAEITLLANFITLTPGTLSLDVIDDIDDNLRDDGKNLSRTLYIHAMHAGSTQKAIERFRTQIQQNLALRVAEVMR
ncbi:MAG: Na+/H+ antiporter subunit E [Chloroflexota bacterium]